MYDLLLRNAEICDGSGAPRQTGNVAVSNGRIAAVGAVEGRAARTIDAKGLVLAPGFIDVHTHYDCQVSWDRLLTPSCWHGVTSVVMGNCGFSIAPCRSSDRELLMQMLLYVEGMPTEALRAGIDWQWETFPEYLDTLERWHPAINVAVFIGHAALRYFTMGVEATQRLATAAEIKHMQDLIREAMQAGACGFSSSESPTHFFGDGTPVPSRVAPREELLALGSVLKESGRGIIEIAPLHILGGSDGKLEDQELYMQLAEASGRPVTWAPLFHNLFEPDGAKRVLDAALAAKQRGVQVVPQVGCRPFEIRITFAAPSIALVNNPYWRPLMEKPLDERRALFTTQAFRDDLRQMSQGGGWVAALGPGWDQIFVRHSPLAAHKQWTDASVAEIAAARGADTVDTLLDLSLESDLACQFGIPVLNTDERCVAELIQHPAAVIALSDAGAHVDSLSDQGFTSYLLGHWVRERQALPMEEAIRLITSVPAELYGLHDRGVIRPGAAADLVLFDAARIGMTPTEMVADLPGGAARLIQRARGIEYVVVNGEVLIDAGKETQACSGQVLRG